MDLPFDVEDDEKRWEGVDGVVGFVLGLGVEGVDFEAAEMAFSRSTSLTLMLLRFVCDARRVSVLLLLWALCVARPLPLIVFSGERDLDLSRERELFLEFAVEFVFELYDRRVELADLEGRSITIIDLSSKSSIDPFPTSPSRSSSSPIPEPIWMGGSGLEVSPGDMVIEGEAEERGGEMGVTGMEDGVVKTSAMGEPTGDIGEGEGTSRGIMGSAGTGGALGLTGNKEDEVCDASVF